MEENRNEDSQETRLYTNKTVNLLANGLVQLYEPSLAKTNKQLVELTEKQSLLVDQLHNENLKIAASQYSIEIQELFNLIKVYNYKLQNIKKSMLSLHDKSIKLKKRSLRLQHCIEKEMYITNTSQQNKPSTSKNL